MVNGQNTMKYYPIVQIEIVYKYAISTFYQFKKIK